MITEEKYISRFIKKFNKGEANECWLWIAGNNGNGYGRVWMGPHGMQTSHRASYLIHKGDIPPNLEVRHTCDVRACVNPNHLILGTHKQNMEDKAERGRACCGNKLKTHCLKGHEFTPENTIIYGPKNYRQCRECNRIRQRIKYARKKDLTESHE